MAECHAHVGGAVMLRGIGWADFGMVILIIVLIWAGYVGCYVVAGL